MSAEGLIPLSNPFTQAGKSKDNSNRKNTNLQLLLNKTILTTTGVVRVMQTNMSTFSVDTYINAWSSVSDQQSAIMYMTSMEKIPKSSKENSRF